MQLFDSVEITGVLQATCIKQLAAAGVFQLENLQTWMSWISDNGSLTIINLYYRQLQFGVKPLKCYGCYWVIYVHPHMPHWEPLIPKKLSQKMTHVMYQFGPTLCGGCSFSTPCTVVKLRRYGMASRGGLLNESHGGVGGVNSVLTFFALQMFRFFEYPS